MQRQPVMQFVWITSITTLLLVVTADRASGRIGKVCKQDGDSVWTCRPQRNCTTASIEEFPKRRNVRPCKASGPEPLVCCRPGGEDLPMGTVSRQMCEEYAESVFVKEIDPLSEELLNRDTCPSLVPLLAHDSPAEPREYPHTAYLGFGPKENITWTCGAVLISNKFVLSAAHCVGRGATKSRWVRIGDYNAYSVEDEDSGLSMSQTIKVARCYKHKQYKEPGWLYNIALLELRDEVEFSEYIRPICLLTEREITINFGIATGWGWGGSEWERADILQKSNMSITVGKACSDHAQYLQQGKLKADRALTSSSSTRSIDDSIFCATDSFRLSTYCKGDSGGPLQIRLSDPYCMYGLLGISSLCSSYEGDIPTVFYTKVSRYTRWIESIVWPSH